MVEKLIYSKIPAIMEDICSIGKDRQNTAQGYKFRGIDDVYNELHSVLAKHKVFTVPKIIAERHEERISAKGGLLLYRVLTIEYTFFAEDGSFVTSVVIGEGMDSGDKASNKAMSVAHKYCLLQVFAIPTEDSKDPENGSPDPLPINKMVEVTTPKKYITMDQVIEISDEVSKRDINKSAFFTFLKIGDFNDLTQDRYAEALCMVKRKDLKPSTIVQRQPGED